MSRRLTPLAAAAVALTTALTALTGCSTVPSSSPLVPITEAPPRPDAEVGIEPLPPEPGAPPEDVVGGFIDAAASSTRGHPVAREYLTEDAAGTWADDTGVTVIGSEYSAIASGPGRVTVTATVVGTVDERGIFDPGGELLTREYGLTEVDGEWRISNPPDGLTMLEPDFVRLYDARPIYFLDPTLRRLVPDPRYVIGGDAQPTALVDRLFEGPAPALRPAVRNPLAAMSLRRAVTVDGTTATVDLAELPPDSESLLAELSAQLVYTLAETRIRSVRVLVDGEPVPVEGVPTVQTVDDWAAYDPDAVPIDAVGHYLDDGALRTVPEGEPVPGPAGEGAYPLDTAAVAADPRDNGELSFTVAATEPDADGRVRLLAGPYGGELTEVLAARSFTEPTVAATRTEAWTVRDGTDVVRLPSGGRPQQVVATTLPGLGRAEALQLSPDGVRAAVVVDGPQGPSLYVGIVVRNADGVVSLRDLQQIAPALAQVADVSWRDSGQLIVLAGDASEDRIVPWTVGVDGWGLEDLSTAGLPSQPTAVAAAPSRNALVEADGSVFGFVNGRWAPVVRGEEPLPGASPFYPL